MLQGPIRKMQVTYSSPVDYALPIGDSTLALNELIGETLTLEFGGEIRCVHCDRKIKKSFNQGYCFPCMRSLAQCDGCIVRPETCHFHLGTCREPHWGETHCMTEHIVYLANSSGVKVGITRASQVPTRWIDQGATQAMPVVRTHSRLQSGLIESVLKKSVADRTDWRRMLKAEAPAVDLAATWETLIDTAKDDVDSALAASPRHDEAPRFVTEPAVEIRYPVSEYPKKVTSLTFDKSPTVAGTLLGIKGQYLMLDCGVINMRRHGGYVISARR